MAYRQAQVQNGDSVRGWRDKLNKFMEYFTFMVRGSGGQQANIGLVIQTPDGDYTCGLARNYSDSFSIKQEYDDGTAGGTEFYQLAKFQKGT